MSGTVKTSFFKLGNTDTPVGEGIRATAVNFKGGWDRARDKGIDITPELRKALIEDLGVDSDRLRFYVDQLVDPKQSRPDANDFKTPVVVPLQRKL